MKENGKKRLMVVRGELLKLGLTLKKAAELAGVKPRMLDYVIRGERTSARVVEALIAAGVPARLFTRKGAKGARG